MYDIHTASSSAPYIKLCQRMLLLISRKYDLGCLSRISDPGSGFFSIPDLGSGSGSRGQKSIGSRIRIRNTRNKISTPLVVEAGSRQLFVSMIRGVDDSPHHEYGEFPENNSARYPESATLRINDEGSRYH
jgi:hypothetical protein